MKCAVCGGSVMRMRELEGEERRCVMCGRAPAADMEAVRELAEADAGRYEASGKTRRREPSRMGQRL